MIQIFLSEQSLIETFGQFVIGYQRHIIQKAVVLLHMGLIGIAVVHTQSGSIASVHEMNGVGLGCRVQAAGVEAVSDLQRSFVACHHTCRIGGGGADVHGRIDVGYL